MHSQSLTPLGCGHAGLREERRVRDIFSLVDPSMPGYHASLAEDANLGRLNVLTGMNAQ